MTKELHKFPCEQCGADARFDPGKDQLVCDHCGHTQLIDEDGPWSNPMQELDFEAAISANLPDADFEELRVVDCTNCAAKIELGADEHAGECPFCASPVVTDTGVHRHIKPKGLLPFVLAEEEARAAMGKWLGKLWFAPNGLDEFARKGRRIQGVYVPFWTYDAQTQSSYSGERGTVYYVTRTVKRNGKTTQVRQAKTRWRHASGRVSRFFDDVLVLASKSLPRSDVDNLAPWDLSGLEPYKPEYLAGYRAEAYSVELDDGYEIARERMNRVILRDVKFDIGGDKQRVHSVNTKISNVTFKHVLLPVWMAAYKFRGETFRVVINGTNGQVSGQRPWSVWKIAMAVTFGLAVAAGVGYFIATNPELFESTSSF
jgi:DNA-directed RNA polymerase subunit RPC12/RpoP